MQVTDGRRVLRCRNGVPMLKLITATGCSVTALIAAALAVAPDQPLLAAAAALCVFGCVLLPPHGFSALTTPWIHILLEAQLMMVQSRSRTVAWHSLCTGSTLQNALNVAIAGFVSSGSTSHAGLLGL